MKVRVLKPFYYIGTNQNLKPGDVVSIKEEEAEPWLKSGLAEQDKVMEAPKETKVIIPPANTKNPPINTQKK
jgi:hypothetical protein